MADDDKSHILERIEIPPAFVSAVGAFLASFSFMEEATDRTIWALLKMTKSGGGQAITATFRDFGQRLALLARLREACIEDTDLLVDSGGVLSVMGTLNEHRVFLVHGQFWGYGPGDGEVLMARVKVERSEVQQRFNTYSPELLYKLGRHVWEATDALGVLRQNVWKGRRVGQPPSLGKPPALP